MKNLRRKTYHSTVDTSENHSVINKKRTATVSGGDKIISQSSDNIVINNKNIQNNQNRCKRQYTKLTIKSLEKQYPLSELRPYSLNSSIKKIYESINDSSPIFRKTSHSHKTNFQQFFKSRAKKNIKVFHQSRSSKRCNKSKFLKTATQFISNSQKTEQQILATDYLKDVNQFMKNQKNKFQLINERIKEQFPDKFQPIIQHQQSKCRSKSCNEGFFKRKKYRVQQKYQVQQPGFQKIKWSTSKHASTYNKNTNYIDKDLSYFMFFKSKNKTLNTSFDTKYRHKESIRQTLQGKNKLTSQIQENPKNNVPSIKEQMQLNELSVSFYKKYMKGSHLQRKKTLYNDFKIKPF